MQNIMIKRIVSMQFRKKKVPEFLEIFRESCESIRAFDGCLYLELLQDAGDPQTYLTLSVWKSEEALNAYRKSELFGHTWKRTKKLFKKHAQARTLTSYIVL